MNSIPFLEDIYPRGFIHAVTIRSPVAKGKLISIQPPPLTGEYKLITAKDIPGENRLDGTNVPVLADANLSYIGEPVAILLGHNKTKLNELASKCDVICEEEEAVFSCKSDNNEIEAVREINIGNVQDIYEYKGTLVTGSFSTGIQDHFYAEPAGAVTWYSDDKENTGRRVKKSSNEFINMTVRTATQWPYHVKRSVTRVLGIDSSFVSIEPTALNLHMDGKLWYPSLVACHAALGTYISKKPVRLLLNREEDFLYTPKRFSSHIDIVSSVDKNDNISAINIDISVNLGAYGVNGKEILDQVCLGSLGLYKFENLKLTAKAYRTNIPPQGPFSGFGLAQGLFAIEQHISQISNMSGSDPAIWRLNNADYKTILPSAQNISKISATWTDLINSVTKKSDYYRKWTSYELLRQSRKNKPQGTSSGAQENMRLSRFAKGDNPRGIGIALGYQSNGLLYPGEDNGNYSVEVTLTKESILEIKASISTPEDYRKIWEKIAIQTMSINPDMIRIESTNAPDCGPSCASRNITAVTKLVERCCVAVRKQRFHEPLPITVRRSVKPQAGSFCNGAMEVMDINGFLKPGLGAAVVEVSINLSECVPVIRGIWLSIDGGGIISINRARRSVKRSSIQALGWAYTEYIEYINGVLPGYQYNNFSIFSPTEIPPVHIEFLGSGDSKGVSDLPFSCIPAAFTQAVSQAMDHCYKSIPLKRNNIWEIFRLRDESVQEPAHK